MKKMRSKWTPQRIVLQVLISLFIIVILTISLGPIVWVFISSFKTNAEIFSGSFMPGHITLDNYRIALQKSPIITFYKNSVIMAIGATMLNVFLLSMSSYVLARFSFRGSGFIKILLTSSLLVPAASILLPVYMTVSSLGLDDTLYALIIVYAAFSIPTSFYILSSYYRTIPAELEEAAQIDGCGFFRTFFSIMLPLTKPALATCSILSYLAAWNEFQYALTLTTSTPNRTLPIALKYFTSQFASNYGQLYAATIIVVLPSIVVYIVLQRHITEGLVGGAVKG